MKPHHLLAAALVTTPVHAEVYGSFGIGVTDYDLGGMDRPISGTVDLGWRPNDFLSAELGYLYLGKGEDNATPPNTFASSGPTIAGTAILPVIERWDVFVKAGLLFWEAETTGTSRQEANGTDPFYGIGTTFRFTEHTGISLQYQILELNRTDTSNPMLSIRRVL